MNRPRWTNAGLFMASLFMSLPTVAETACVGTAGAIVACQINRAYNDSTMSCGKDSEDKNGLQCSGVLIRAAPGVTHPAWESKIDRGMSFSFLRKDVNFGRPFNSRAGIVFYPPDNTPPGKVKATVMCGFPFDGVTMNRPDLCGIYPSAGPRSAPCHTLTPPILTAQAWATKFLTEDIHNGDNPNVASHSCGLSFRTNAVANFQAFVGARNLVIQQATAEDRHYYFNAVNEVIVAPWENNAKSMPLQAFFYVSGASDGLTSAQAFQRQFAVASGNSTVIPIIQLAFPVDNDSAARFTFDPKDQSDLNQVVDARMSTFAATPKDIVADGLKISTLTLIARNAAGKPVTGIADLLTVTTSVSHSIISTTDRVATPGHPTEGPPGVYTAMLTSKATCPNVVTATPRMDNTAIGALRDEVTLVVPKATAPVPTIDTTRSTFAVTNRAADHDHVLTLTAIDAQGRPLTGIASLLSFDGPSSIPLNITATPIVSPQPGVYVVTLTWPPARETYSFTITPQLNCAPIGTLRGTLTDALL